MPPDTCKLRLSWLMKGRHPRQLHAAGSLGLQVALSAHHPLQGTRLAKPSKACRAGRVCCINPKPEACC